MEKKAIEDKNSAAQEPAGAAGAPQNTPTIQGGEAAAEGATDTAQEGQHLQGGEAAAAGSEGTGEEQQAKPAKASAKNAKNAKNLLGNEQAPAAEMALTELVKAYSKLYPKCRQFHVTSDLMVFLENDLNAAQFHQRSLPDGQVQTLKRAD